jgi:plasmid maintenance system killer protein
MARKILSPMTTRLGSTRRIWQGEVVTGIPSHIQQLARLRMHVLNNVASPEDLRRLPHLRLKRVDRKLGRDFYAMRVYAGWQLRFEWRRGAARDVELLDRRRY